MYSCLTYSDALTCPEVFRIYIRRKTKFRKNTFVDIFVNIYWSKLHRVKGSFQYKRYRKLDLKRVNNAYFGRQFRRLFRPIIKNNQVHFWVNRYVVKK